MIEERDANEVTAPRDVRDTNRRRASLLLTSVGVLILAVDVLISIPFAVPVLSDPSSHEAQDAGIVAVALLVPMALVGIVCLCLAFALRATRAAGVALLTALAVVGIVIVNLGGGPLLWLAIGVGITGAVIAAWFGYRDRKGRRQPS